MKIQSFKIVFPAILCFIPFFFVSGQTAITLPSTPEAQSLLKAVNTQVNKCTGIAGLTVPLCDAGSGAVSVPVSLSYTCAAIKVQDIASWVGTGWKLSVGGKITRVIADNDDLAGGYCRGQGVEANDFASWWSGGRVKEERKDRHSDDPCTGCLSFDGEPDLFYYEIPAGSGMFILDYSGKAWTIPYSNLKIELQNDDTFLITDEAGTKYLFTLTERTTKISHSDRRHTYTSGSPYGENSKIESYISSWHLTQIEGLYGEKVTFSYEAGREIGYENKNYSQLDNEEIRDESVYFKTTPYYLQKMVWNTGKLEFESSEGRTDLNRARRLDMIHIYSPESVYRKSLCFTYSTFASQRLRLDKIEEISGYSSATLGKYEYFTDYNLPGRNSKDIDHWGYYNGKGNSSWFPYDGASRTPSLVHTRANLLKKAYNSLGGYNEYDYEVNSLPDGKIVGGVRIKSIKTGDANGHVQTVTYSYSYGTSFNTYEIYDNKILDRVLKYSYSTLNLHDIGGSNVYYGQVSENLPNGSFIVSQYTTYDDFDDVRSFYYTNSSQPTENGVPSLMPNSSRFWRRGLLKGEITYDNSQRLIKQIANAYQFPQHPKKRIKGFYQVSNVTSLGNEFDMITIYDWISEPVYLTVQAVWDTKAFTHIRSFTYDTTYCLPVEEKVLCENGDSCSSITRYAYSYDAPGNSSGYGDENAIGFLLSEGLKFTPIERLDYKNGQIVRGELTLYRKYQIGDNKFIPVTYKKKILTSVPVEVTAFVPSAVNSAGQFYHDNRYETVQTFDNYDLKGRLLSWHNRDGIQRSAVYPAEGDAPVAEIENARYAIPMNLNNQRVNEVFYTSFEEDKDAVSFWKGAKTGDKACNRVFIIDLNNMLPGDYKLSYWKSVDNGQSWQYIEKPLEITPSSLSVSVGSIDSLIDEVRIIPVKASIVSNTYIPAIGKTSEMDANGLTVYYRYDELGRLVRVMDDERKTVKDYEYFINFK